MTQIGALRQQRGGEKTTRGLRPAGATCAALLMTWAAVITHAPPASASDAGGPPPFPMAMQSNQSAAPVARAASPPFTVRQEAGRWWLADPAGKRFFSSGVCCVNRGPEADKYDPKRPEYAAFREYPAPADWADATVARLRSWGFTTVGGWSEYDTLRASRVADLPFTPVLHVGSSSGAPWFDMWDPKVIAVMDEVARSQIVPLRDDPSLLGYYTDNEMGWWNGALLDMTLAQPPTSEQRRGLLRLLHEQYQDNWAWLLQDFVPEGAASFADLDRAGKLFLRPGGRGIRPVKRWLAQLADRYYAVVREVVRKHDRRGLLLGDRYQSFYFPEVARASRRHVDAVSTNLNAWWIDGTFPRFYLATLHELSGRPVMVGEFYMTATENRSGNKNDASGFPVVATQSERAVGFATTLSALAATPYVVGADWFQYYDEPTFGRGDGENYDMGLVDIDDRPYEEMAAASAALDRNVRHAGPALVRPDACGGVPPAPKDPMAAGPLATLAAWDRERGFVPPATRAPIADLYLCWNEDAVFVGLCAMDALDEAFYQDKQIPEVDRAEWVLKVAGARKAVRIRVGARRSPAAAGGSVEVIEGASASHGVRIVAAAKLPAALFGRQKLRAGDEIRLDCAFVSAARAYTNRWRGAYRLSQ